MFQLKVNNAINMEHVTKEKRSINVLQMIKEELESALRHLMMNQQENS